MLEKAIPLSDVLARLAECAQRRQPWALKLILSYRWGEPVQRAEVSGPDGESLTFGVQAVDYRTGMDALAPGSVRDSDTPG